MKLLITTLTIFYCFTFSAHAGCSNWEELGMKGAPKLEICFEGDCYLSQQYHECTNSSRATASFDFFSVDCNVQSSGSGYDTVSSANECTVSFKGNDLTDQQLLDSTCTDLDEENQYAIRNMIVGQGADYFVTAVFNRDTNFIAARNNLRDWHARIDRHLLGKHWCKKGEVERTFFWAFPEHPDSNLHYHLMVKLSDPVKREMFETIADACWQEIVSSGDMKVDYLETASDLVQMADYSTKDLGRGDLIENYIISSMFINKKKSPAKTASNASE